ncbi:MAG: hypothetical protein O7G84_13615 [Gammaproteobacteria bacterium]|nr:hypothetical protein [Gammaproteobacteria bacterium]
MTDTAIQKRDERPLANLVGTYRSADEANDRMAWAAEHAHLISPASSVGALPEGVGLALTAVVVDPETDVYKTDGGKLGLGKSTLQKIAHAVGVSWNPTLSGRMDDGSNPYYVRWKAVGTYRAFDGQEQTICAEKELDLRNGSPAARELKDRQLAQMRLHIQAHAETKAQLRAIRSLGIKTSYSREELQKPFVAARVLFTGETSDPELKRIFAQRTADAFLGGSKMLYGDAPAQPLPALAPPPVGTVPADPDDVSGFMDTVEQPPAPAPAQQKREQSKPRESAEVSGHVIPGGRSKGTPIEKADVDDLKYWARRFGEDLDGGKSRAPERDQDMLQAFEAELASRGSKL